MYFRPTPSYSGELVANTSELFCKNLRIKRNNFREFATFWKQLVGMNLVLWTLIWRRF